MFSPLKEIFPKLHKIKGFLPSGLYQFEYVFFGEVSLKMFEPRLKVIPIDDFVLISIKQFKKLINFLIHILVLNDTKSRSTYIETIERN